MASVVTQSIAKVTDNVKVIKLACTAHTDGTFADVVIDATAPGTPASGEVKVSVRGWWLYKYQIVIGATGPTAATDFTIKDSFGIDILGGQGTDGIPATGTNEDYPKIADQAANQPVVTPLTLAIANNAVNAAVFDIYLYFKKVLS
jgi:3D (Asp-Asp-Asp) domain-containing protein